MEPVARAGPQAWDHKRSCPLRQHGPGEIGAMQLVHGMEDLGLACVISAPDRGSMGARTVSRRGLIFLRGGPPRPSSYLISKVYGVLAASHAVLGQIEPARGVSRSG